MRVEQEMCGGRCENQEEDGPRPVIIELVITDKTSSPLTYGFTASGTA